MRMKKPELQQRATSRGATRNNFDEATERPRETLDGGTEVAGMNTPSNKTTPQNNCLQTCRIVILFLCMGDMWVQYWRPIRGR
jgi:hypothetical protein